MKLLMISNNIEQMRRLAKTTQPVIRLCEKCKGFTRAEDDEWYDGCLLPGQQVLWRNVFPEMAERLGDKFPAIEQIICDEWEETNSKKKALDKKVVNVIIDNHER